MEIEDYVHQSVVLGNETECLQKLKAVTIQEAAFISNKFISVINDRKFKQNLNES